MIFIPSSGILRYIILVLVLVVFATSLLTGCVSYRLGSKRFDSPEEALNFQSKIFSEAKSMIRPSQNRVGGTALILIPSDDELVRNYIRFEPGAKKESIEFLVFTTRNFIQFQAEATTIRRIFDSVEVKRHEGNPANKVVENNDFLIFLDVDGWHIKGRNKPRSILILTLAEMRRIFDYEVQQLVTGSLEFLDALNQKASELRSN
jgi:hypothetical protein